MKSKILLFGLTAYSLNVHAQNMFSMYGLHPADTLRNETREQAIRYPSLRQASVTVNIFGTGNFESALNGKDFASGKSRNARISSFFTVPVSKWDGNVISATIYHNEQFFDVREVNNKLTDPQINKGEINKSTLGLSLNFSRTDEIFHTPVLYSVVFTGISDNLRTLKRFNFNGSVTFPLKRREDVSLSVGALVQIDPSAPFPVLPILNYYRKLNNNGLQLIIDFPQGLSLRQSLSRSAWIYVGSNANTFTSFYQSHTSLPERFSYNTIELKSGPGIEYLFGKCVIIGISGGINTISSSKAIAKGDHYTDAFITNDHKSTPYGEFHISLLPFR